jgi:hypothetical protein
MVKSRAKSSRGEHVGLTAVNLHAHLSARRKNGCAPRDELSPSYNFCHGDCGTYPNWTRISHSDKLNERCRSHRSSNS